MTTNIQTDLKEHIADAHEAAQAYVKEARGGVDKAVNAYLSCAQLVEKAKQLHKQDVRGYLSEIMSGDQVKSYISVNDAAKKGRLAIHDKRQLLMTGIIDHHEVETPRNVTPATPTIYSGASKFIGSFNKQLMKRPVEQWSESEREQTKDVLRPIIELFNKL